ncbi:Bax inhibitor-1/YccA family protein [Phormidium sp. CLA17]|uniref:Bax inhibitor-1/YccA family protein n=1 Tax=Leptolyngbya sp. Cla-17 TaxID=2803751 RepID=UPI0014924246|nr:Bax inhibitor-1 family protein [Leptolyngbya sp. Cla-17]MBM0742950.1 Bax inhibitor-1/YccA family protein [Leptolyngbya sp. Cla-17]
MVIAAQARPTERAKFIQKTYIHLAGAVLAFVLLSVFLFQTGIAEVLTRLMTGSRFSWLAVLGVFMLLGWLSRELAAKADSVGTQYAGLGLYVVLQAILFTPLLYIAALFSDPSVIPTAAILTLLMFAGLTAVVFISRKDFSFLGSILTIGGFIAMGVIICSAIFGFTLGLFFSFIMVVFASAAILYDTSKVLHNYSTNQYVAASLELFASVALLFWYVLQIVMSFSRR